MQPRVAHYGLTTQLSPCVFSATKVRNSVTSCICDVWLLTQRDDPWTVRLLPKVHFGVHPVGLDGIEPDAPGITVLHHYLGTWKVRGGWSRNRVDLYRLWRKAKSYMGPESR